MFANLFGAGRLLNAASLSALIDRIYEAAIATELWPGILEEIGTGLGAQGSVFIAMSPSGTDWICAPRLEEHMAAYAAAGWAADPEHTAPLFADTHAGFRAETAYRTIPEIEALPVKRDFMIPRGLIAAAASVFQGASDDALYMTVEGFPEHLIAENAVPTLDRLRPHIGRALSLSAKVRQARTDALVTGLEIAGVGAAVIGGDKRLKSSNTRFQEALGSLMIERRGLLNFTDAFLEGAVQSILKNTADPESVASVMVRTTDGFAPLVLHLIPLRGRGREVCGSDGVLLLTANVNNQVLPNADLLRLLFDLTPAEARVARMLGEGLAVAHIAQLSHTSMLTVRTHLRTIFQKTGVRRQAELVRLLGSLRTPSIPTS